MSRVNALVAFLCSSIEKNVIKIFSNWSYFSCCSAEDSGFLNILSEIFLSITTTNMNFQGSMCLARNLAGNLKNKNKIRASASHFFLLLPLMLFVLHACQCVISDNVINICFSVSVIQKWVIHLRMLRKFLRGRFFK